VGRAADEVLAFVARPTRISLRSIRATRCAMTQRKFSGGDDLA
jgi:hypothetical protein